MKTIEEAKQLVDTLLADNLNRTAHIYGVVSIVKDLCVQYGLSEEETNLAIQSAYLHDIGYAEDLNLNNFHAVDGFEFLKKNGWHDVVSMVALHHTYSGLLAKMSREDLTHYYSKYPLTEEFMKYFFIVTEADLQTSGKGITVSFEERIADIQDRYGAVNVITKHILEVQNLVNDEKNYFQNIQK